MHNNNGNGNNGNNGDADTGRGKKDDKVRLLQTKVDGVKRGMEQTVEAALQNVARAEELAVAAEELSVSAADFRQKAGELRRKLWWQEMRQRLAVLGVMAVVASILAVAIFLLARSAE